MRSKRLAAVATIAMALIVACSLVAILGKGRSISDTTSSSYTALSRPQAMPVQPTSDDRHLRIQPETLAEGQATFFVYDTENKPPVRFFIVRLSEQRYAAALDTCKGCYAKGLGYASDGNVLVCRKCGHRVALAMDLLQQDDCHPVKLSISTDGDISVSVDEMMALASQYTPLGAASQ